MPAFIRDAKFKLQCEFHHSAPPERCVRRKGIGKPGFFGQSAVSFSLVVIYITSFFVSVPI
jgi:hypothetical protein